MKIEMGKRYTSNGEPIRILCIDKPEKYSVIGMLEKTGVVQYFKKNGENAVFSSRDLVEVWEPTEGEWCWFWDDMSKQVAHLRKYLKTYSEMVGESFVSTDGCAWDNCAKFEGKLPEHLKA